MIRIAAIVFILMCALGTLGCEPAKTQEAVNEEAYNAESGTNVPFDAIDPEIMDQTADYPDPKAYGDEFVVAEVDPQTGAAWDQIIGIIHTNRGKIKIKFFHDDAPRHVENFVYLARTGFFTGLTWHRYEAGFVIQGGDPLGTGAGGPGYQIPAEINERKHKRAALAAARTGDESNPERKSSGSQFYIVLDNAPHLDGNYTLWGWVTEGMGVALSLRKGDAIHFIEIREKK